MVKVRPRAKEQEVIAVVSVFIIKITYLEDGSALALVRSCGSFQASIYFHLYIKCSFKRLNIHLSSVEISLMNAALTTSEHDATLQQVKRLCGCQM